MRVFGAEWQSKAALDTVQMEHSEAMDGAEQAVAQLHQLREAHDSLHTQKSALYEVIDHMHESAAVSDAEPGESDAHLLFRSPPCENF